MMKYLLPLLALFCLAGCVTAGRYKAQEAEAQSQKQRADQLDAKVSQAGKDLEAAKTTSGELQTQLRASADQLAGLHKSHKDLQETLDAKKGELNKKVGELIKERDELSQRLSAAEAARKALEDAAAAELTKVRKNYEDLTAGLKSEIAAGEIRITELKGKLTVNMVDRILFDSGQAEVKSNGRMVLDKVGGLLNNVSGKDIRIEGHTDNKPIVGELRAKYPTNWELSAARATAVTRYLEEHAKVDPSRLVAAGYGEYRPVASNDAPESRALNRRIELILVPRD